MRVAVKNIQPECSSSNVSAENIVLCVSRYNCSSRLMTRKQIFLAKCLAVSVFVLPIVCWFLAFYPRQGYLTLVVGCSLVYIN